MPEPWSAPILLCAFFKGSEVTYQGFIRPSATLSRIGLMVSRLRRRRHGGPPSLVDPPPQAVKPRWFFLFYMFFFENRFVFFPQNSISCVLFGHVRKEKFFFSFRKEGQGILLYLLFLISVGR